MSQILSNFAALWVGNPLTNLQKTCLASFVYYGHTVDLFVYDMDMEVPSGIKKVDASTIMPEKDLFKVDNSYAAFSDLFRYKMIKETGLIWIDADIICLSDNWNFDNNIFASIEDGDWGTFVNGGILSLNKNSEIVDFLIDESFKFDKDKIIWSEVGPALLTTAFNKFDYMQYAYPQETFLGIGLGEFKDLWDPNKKNKILDLYKTSKSISAYNHQVVREGINRDTFPLGSAMDYFYNKFIGTKK